MDHHFSSGACSSFLFEEDEQRLDFEMDEPGAFLNAHQHVPHDQQAYVDHNAYDYSLHSTGQYPTTNFEYQTQRSHHRHQSTSTQSSHSSAFRSSNGSTFSQWQQPRFSIASTNTTCSQLSDYSREQHVARAECALDSHSHPLISPPLAATFGESIAFPSAKRAAPRQQAPATKKNPWETCVSRTKRSRPLQKAPRYWCTSCEEGFGEKYDWKRHEEAYQERMEMFECDLCDNIYFLVKDFVGHHKQGHRCRVCAEKQHLDLARRQRIVRTGWGCGFCDHFSPNWAERCSHISFHFEREGKTMNDWHHSQVIISLLQRPEIIPHWNHLLKTRQPTHSVFGWNFHSTGRVEGYPEADPIPQLQDLLEYYTPDQNVATIIQLAYQKGIKQKSIKEKELPPLPVPENDCESVTQQSMQHATSQPPRLLPLTNHDLAGEVLPWNNFLGTIQEDEMQPTGVCMLDLDILDAAFHPVQQDYHF